MNSTDKQLTQARPLGSRAFRLIGTLAVCAAFAGYVVMLDSAGSDFAHQIGGASFGQLIKGSSDNDWPSRSSYSLDLLTVEGKRDTWPARWFGLLPAFLVVLLCLRALHRKPFSVLGLLLVIFLTGLALWLSAIRGIHRVALYTKAGSSYAQSGDRAVTGADCVIDPLPLRPAFDDPALWQAIAEGWAGALPLDHEQWLEQLRFEVATAGALGEQLGLSTSDPAEPIIVLVDDEWRAGTLVWSGSRRSMFHQHAGDYLAPFLIAQHLRAKIAAAEDVPWKERKATWDEFVAASSSPPVAGLEALLEQLAPEPPK